MPIAVLMPALSPTMTEGTVARWLKKTGDIVKPGDVLAEIETDKAVMEVEAVDDGKLARIVIQEGKAGVKVNSLIAVLLDQEEADEDVDVFIAQMMDEVSIDRLQGAAESPQKQSEEGEAQGFFEQKPLTVGPSSSKERILASPLAKRLAQQKGIDLSALRGSGPKGRIIKSDVENFTPVALSSLQKEEGLLSVKPSSRIVPLSSMRKIIGERLSFSKQTIPHFYLTIDLEMDALLKLREQINRQQDRVKVSVNDMLIKALAMAFKQVPQANVALIDGQMHCYEAVDVSVAVAIEGGLVTPVVRQADNKPLLIICEEIKYLAGLARSGRLKPEDWQGGCVTLSNLGMYGIDQFEAIINPPQSCILAVGACVKKPVVMDDEIKVASVMKATLSADHRVVDGAIAAELLGAFKEAVHKPLKLILG